MDLLVCVFKDFIKCPVPFRADLGMGMRGRVGMKVSDILVPS